MDDLYRMVDDRQAAVLICLDLSAAFDTIDHSVLLSRLQSVFEVSGVALAVKDWFLENGFNGMLLNRTILKCFCLICKLKLKSCKVQG